MRPSPLFAAALMLGMVPPAAAAPGCVGGMVLPGTATCLRLGGIVRAEAVAGGATVVPAAGAASGTGHGRAGAALRTGARVDLDARVPTAAGPIRAYLSVGAGEAIRR